MNRTHKAIVEKYPCQECGAVIGHRCINSSGGIILRSVHLPRMICPVCGRRYDERSGNGFRHWMSGNKWCRLPKEVSQTKCL